MELIERFRHSRNRNGDHPSDNNSVSSWLKNKKMQLGVIAGFIVALLIFLGVFLAGKDLNSNTTPDQDSVIPAEPRRSFEKKQPLVLPPLKWNEGECLIPASTCPQSYQEAPPLILISLDGFHPDYLKRGFTPTLNRIAECGVKADYLYPVYPSKTFPNHYSIVTGLNPPSHGLIDNSMYDRGKLFKVGDPEMFQPYWYQKDPIWVTAEKQGRKTASFYWVGSDVKINGTYPTYYQKYVSKLSFDTRVDQILEWITLPPEKRPRLLTLYVNQPDHAGHANGISSRQVNQALSNVDQMIARLYSGLQVNKLIDCVNIIILSDHGMTNADCNKVIDIQKYIKVSDVFFTAGPLGRLRPKGRRNATIIKNIVSKLKCNSRHMRVYEKEHLPVRMHFADNARIEPIILDIDDQWTVVSRTSKPGDSICSNGAHGYDNLFDSMRAIFMAHGPSFKKNMAVRPFINTELYELFSELIDITPNPNNGTRGSLHEILVSPKSLPPQRQLDPPATSFVPKEEEQYNDRVNAAECSCSQPRKQEDVNDIALKRSQHLPFGVPFSSEDNSTLRLLYQEDYVSAFDLKYRIPMWTSFTLDGKKFSNFNKVDQICWTGDSRIPFSDTSKCGDYEKPAVKNQYILQQPLFPPGFSDPSLREQASYVSNSIPKSLNHTQIVQERMNQILWQWAVEHEQLHVMMGPAFDLLATGIRPDIRKIIRTHENNGPVIVPTHIFVVVTWCSVKKDGISDCNPTNLKAIAFILPNKPYTQNCEAGEFVIQKNVARVVDVEKLTGLSFYTGLPIYDAIRLRTMMPKKSFSTMNL